MKVKTKENALAFIESFKKHSFNLSSGHNTFYFYNKDEKKHNFMLEHSGKFQLITIDPFDDDVSKTEVSNVSDFVWEFRKYINKSLGSYNGGAHPYHEYLNGIF